MISINELLSYVYVLVQGCPDNCNKCYADKQKGKFKCTRLECKDKFALDDNEGTCVGEFYCHASDFHYNILSFLFCKVS